MDIKDLRVTTDEVMGPQMQRLQSLAIPMAVVGGVLTVVGGLLGGGFNRVFPSYLFAYVFWIGATAGALGLLMLHHTVGGGWGFIIRRFLEAATAPTMWIVMLVLFIPIALGIPVLYEWARPEAAADPVLREKAPWLNLPFFLVRTVIYFAFWFLASRLLRSWGDTQDERADPDIYAKLNYAGGIGLVLYVLVTTFMAVDWVLSLTPHWVSSIIGLLFVVMQGLTGLALNTVLFNFLVGDRPLAQGIPTGYFRDLGNFTLAFVMLWAYMSFSQFLITYSGNMHEEAPFYLSHASHGWQLITGALITLHFTVPFLVLLTGSEIKRRPQLLAYVAGFIIFMRFVDLFWWVTPTFQKTLISLKPFALGLNPADLGTPLLIGGIWLYLWVNQLKGRYVVPIHDPRFELHAHELTHAPGHEAHAHV